MLSKDSDYTRAAGVNGRLSEQYIMLIHGESNDSNSQLFLTLLVLLLFTLIVWLLQLSEITRLAFTP